jgi:hypothetical protein
MTRGSRPSEEEANHPPPRALVTAVRQDVKISKNKHLQGGGIGQVRRTEICTCCASGGTYEKNDRSGFGQVHAAGRRPCGSEIVMGITAANQGAYWSPSMFGPESYRCVEAESTRLETMSTRVAAVGVRARSADTPHHFSARLQHLLSASHTSLRSSQVFIDECVRKVRQSNSVYSRERQ